MRLALILLELAMAPALVPLTLHRSSSLRMSIPQSSHPVTPESKPLDTATVEVNSAAEDCSDSSSSSSCSSSSSRSRSSSSSSRKPLSWVTGGTLQRGNAAMLLRRFGGCYLLCSLSLSAVSMVFFYLIVCTGVLDATGARTHRAVP